MNGLPAGTVVALAGDPDDTADRAEIVAGLDCPGCGGARPAYRVRRLAGAFPGWPTNEGLWHACDTAAVPVDERGHASG